jgi:3-methyladenine DNA glycosylase/8-oxoguanine DNA glycosylase
MGCWAGRRCARLTPRTPSSACSRSRASARSPRSWWWSAARTPPDALPHHERRLDAEIAERYGPDRTLAEVSQAWRPYRTWTAVHLRALREQRTAEISGR